MRTTVKKTGFVLLAGLLVLIAILLVNTLRFTSRQLTDVPPAPALTNFPTDSAVARLSAAIRCQTVAFTDYRLSDTTQFDKFLELIRRQFPLTHQQLRRETVNNYGLLYTWPGRNSRLPPILLTAHYDVVPVIQGTERMWKIPPFAGQVEYK